MNAVISGVAGRALVVDGESLRSFDVDDPSNLLARQRFDLPYLFGEASDLRIIERSDLASIGRELHSESDLSLALDLALISLDEEIEKDIRAEAIRDVNELLINSQLRERLESVLYARPIPGDGDLSGALALCDEQLSSISWEFFENLHRRQVIISRVSEAWDFIPAKVFEGYEHQANSLRIVVGLGLFRAFVITLEMQQPISTFLLAAGLNKSINELHNYRDVLQHWARRRGCRNHHFWLTQSRRR